MASYNLIDEAWIPVMLYDGTNLHVSITDAFEHAGDIALVGGDAFTRLVVLRLLAAIHARALSAAGHGDDTAIAQHLWDENSLDTATVAAYLHAWADRFDLLDPVRPFMQDPTLHVKNPKPARTLTPWNRDHGPFNPATDRRDTIPANDATIGLLLDLAYDTQGIKAAPGSGRAYNPVPGVMCTGWPGSAIMWTPRTGSLARDVLAMTPMPYSADDLPCWERNPLGGDDILVWPTGPIQSWTLPTRRIRLHADDTGMVESASVTYGVVADPTVMHDTDPLSTLNQTTGGPVYRMDAERPLWLPDPWLRPESRPRWFAWAARLMGDETLTCVECSTAVYDQSVIEDMPSMYMRIQSRWLGTTGDEPARLLHAVRQMADAWTRMQRRFDIGAGRRLPESIAAQATSSEILRDRHTMADMLRDLTPMVEQTMSDPAADALDTGVRRIGAYMRNRGEEALEQHAALAFNMRYPAAEALNRFAAGIKVIMADWRTVPITQVRRRKPVKIRASGMSVSGESTPTSADAAPGRRGRKGKPVIRSGGDLPDERFDSAKQAVEWLREHGHATANAPSISSVCNGKTRTAYGYQWRFA